MKSNGLSELLACGGVVAAGDWTTGTGNYVKRRAIPPFCKELYAEDWDAGELRGAVGVAYRRLKRARPRVRKVIAVTNLRAARRVVV